MLIYRIIDDLDYSPEELQKLIASLPEWRRQQAMKFKFHQGRLECALSYHLLSEMLGYQPDFIIGEHGKPGLYQEKDTVDAHCSRRMSVERTFFNLSHCKNAVACIICDEGEVGIDVECLGRYKQDLAEYCMSDEELWQIATADDPDTQFTLLWTKKEALLKCTGEGIIDDMKVCLKSGRTTGISLKSGVNKEKGYAWSIAFNPCL